MPGVEGFTPEIAWTTFYGFIALCILFMVVYRVYDAIRNEIEKRRQKRESETPDLADKVSKKVLETLEPRFQEIEKNLARDKSRLDGHDVILSSTRDGLAVICKTLLVIISYSDISNNEKVKEASAELTRYLADRL